MARDRYAEPTCENADRRFQVFAYRTRAQSRGYTLLELLLVLAILGTLATLVIPSFYRQYLDYRITDQATSEVMESMLFTKELAIRTGSPHVYEFQPGTHIQKVYPADRPESCKELKIHPKARLEPVLTTHQKVQRLVYRGDGGTEGIRMQVVGPKQSQTIVVERHLGIPQRSKGTTDR